MRPYWKGYLKLALVSCPIALHAACSTAERIALRQINKATGNRLRQQLIDEETREPVDPEHKGRGYEVAKGQYLIVEDEELEAIEIESSHVIEIDSFVPRQQIDQRFLDTPYYVAPNEPVAEAMRHTATVALGGLDPDMAKLLDGLARGDKPGADRLRRLKPGTVLVREYQGERHTVTVVPGRLPLARGDLRKPLHHRARHHRHGLEWAALLCPARSRRRQQAQAQISRR